MMLSRLAIRSALMFCGLMVVPAAALAQLAPPPSGSPNDQNPSSVLFYNKYTSNPSNPQAADTQINITNTSPDTEAQVHLFFVDGSTCSVADAFISLTANQTATFLASDFDPGVQGYLVAVAAPGGTPAQFNYLIGDAYIRENDGRLARLAAVGLAKVSPGPVTPNGDGTASLIFNGAEYDRLASVVAVASFNSQVTDSTNLAIYSPTNNLVTGNPVTTNIFTLVYDDTERAFSTTTRVVCYNQIPLTSLRVLSGGLNSVVPAGRTGWIKLNGQGRPLLGAVLNRGPIFTGGINLHNIALLPTYTITVPSF